MTTNLRITSIVGFYNSTGTFIGPTPLIKTALALEGGNPNNIIRGRKILTVSTVTDFYIVRGNTSTAQTVTLSNIGDDLVTIYGIDFTADVTTPVVEYNSLWTSSGTAKISPGSSISLSLAYRGNTEGLYTNSLIIKSDADGSSYVPYKSLGLLDIRQRIFTSQTVDNKFYFSMSPSQIITTSTFYGQVTGHSISITPYNQTTSSYQLSLSGSSGFSILSSSTSRVRIIFDNNKVNDVNGLYTATLLATAFGGTTSSSVVLTHNINLDSTKFYHYADWLSAGAPTDSIVGISYDKINGIRYITIGVGAGANGAPAYNQGGAEALDVVNLGIEATTGLTQYAYWAKVYRIPLEESPINQPKTYYSGDYQVKNVGVDYDQYFGENYRTGSMFIIENDGFNNILIKMNHLRETPTDPLITTTLENLSRSFYYYSPLGNRYYQLGSPIGDGFQTNLFAGFNNDGSIITFLVAYPL